MIKRILSNAAQSMIVAACGGDQPADDTTVTDSTSVTTMPGSDTVPVPTVVPTTDSVVTTTTVETDTVRGEAQTDTPATTTP